MPKLRKKDNLTLLDQLGICFFNGTYTTKGQKQGTEDIPFFEYIDSVRNPDDEYITEVELIRRVKKCKSLAEAMKLKVSKRILKRCKKVKDLYSALKWKAYQVYPSCQFDKAGCRIKNVTNVSGLLVYDLQNVEQEIYAKLCEWKHTVALHMSIGGAPGDYALFLYCPGLTVESFNGMWEKGNDLITKEFGIKPDNSDECKDVTRIRYLSYDPDIYYNPYAEPILVQDIVITTQFTDEQKAKINKYLNSEPKWFKFLMALAVAKGEDGRQLAHTFSKENPKKYNATDLDKKYDRLLDEVKHNKREEGITAATLFWQLKEMNVPYLAPRNQIHNSSQELCAAEVIKYLNENWGRNQINDKIYNIKTGRETNVETVWTTFQLTFNDPKGFSINTIQAFLRSEAMNTFNPIKTFFDDCIRVYDGGKYIKKLISALPFTDPDTADLFIRYWCISAYRQAYANEVNRLFLIFQGAEEIGKSRALEWLCPLPEYLKTSPLHTDNKDTRIALAHNFLWIDDELKVFKAHDINKIKALVSQNIVSERAPYARSAETYKRICSFCGSTNENEIMPANEGNTRFLICEFSRKADWQSYMKIDKKQFWGEVITLYENGWIEKNREKLTDERRKVNKNKIMNDVLTDLLKNNFVSTANDQKRIVYTLQEVVDEIDPERRYNAVSKQEFLRSILTKMFGQGRTSGYNPKTGTRTTGYPCRQKGDKIDAKRTF